MKTNYFTAIGGTPISKKFYNILPPSLRTKKPKSKKQTDAEREINWLVTNGTVNIGDIIYY